jgi:hypothetical protein
MPEAPDEAALESSAVDLPRHLTVDELAAAVEDVDTLLEVQRECRIRRERLKSLCYHLGIGEHLRQQQGHPATADTAGGQSDA